METSTEAIFAKYLADVEAAVQGLSKQVRQEVMSSLRSHITEAIEDRHIASTEDAYELIANLGDPMVIAAEAGASEEVPRKGPDSERRILGWLTLGSLIPIAGWVYGVLLLWASPIWTKRDKIIGTALVPGGIFTGLLALLAIFFNSGEVCTDSQSGETSGIGGTPVGIQATRHYCQSIGALSLWEARVLFLVTIVAMLAGPLWLGYRASLARRL